MTSGVSRRSRIDRRHCASPMSSSPCVTATSCAVAGAALMTARPTWPRAPVISTFMETYPRRRIPTPAASFLASSGVTPAGNGHSMPSVRVVPQQRALVRRRVVVSALVLKIRRFGQHEESMRESGRHPQHVVVSLGQLHAHPAAERRRAAAQIDRDVEYRAAGHAHQFSLRVLHLVMQAAQACGGPNGCGCPGRNPGRAPRPRNSCGSTIRGRIRDDRRTPSDAAAPRPEWPVAGFPS